MDVLVKEIPDINILYKFIDHIKHSIDVLT